MSTFKLVLAITLVGLSGCGKNMVNDGHEKPYQQDKSFPDGSSARPFVAGTVAQNQLKPPTPYFTGYDHGHVVTKNPLPYSKALLQEGQENFNIYCAVCHARTGEGNGMVVQRGFPKPPSYFEQRLLQAPDGHFFDVMTHGYGRMARYSDVLDEHQRWAIVAYIRALQKSRQGKIADAPQSVQDKLNSLKSADTGPVYE